MCDEARLISKKAKPTRRSSVASTSSSSFEGLRDFKWDFVAEHSSSAPSFKQLAGRLRLIPVLAEVMLVAHSF